MLGGYLPQCIMTEPARTAETLSADTVRLCGMPLKYMHRLWSDENRRRITESYGFLQNRNGDIQPLSLRRCHREPESLFLYQSDIAALKTT